MMRAGIHRNAAADQIQHGSFAGSVAADNGNKLAVIDAEVEIVKEAHFIYSACVVIFTGCVLTQAWPLPPFSSWNYSDDQESDRRIAAVGCSFRCRSPATMPAWNSSAKRYAGFIDNGT